MSPSQNETARTRRFPRLLPFLVALGALTVGCGSETGGPTGPDSDLEASSTTRKTLGASPGTSKGLKALDFTLENLDGKGISLKSLAGKPVFLNFWATWCAPCRAEMPDMETLKKDLGDQIQIVGINLGESSVTVKRFVREEGYTWTFLIDQKMDVGRLYGVEFIPTSIFVNAEGIITARHTSTLNRATMKRLALEAIGSSEG